MKSHDFASIIFKALGIYWLVQGMIHIIHGAFMPLTASQIRGSIGGNILTIEIINWLFIGALYASVSYFLIFRTKYVIELLNLDKDLTDSDSNTEKINVEALSFSLIGIYFAVPALGNIVPRLIAFLSYRQSDLSAFNNMMQAESQRAYFDKVLPDLIENITIFVVGIILIAGSNRLAQLWRRLRPLSR